MITRARELLRRSLRNRFAAGTFVMASLIGGAVHILVVLLLSWRMTSDFQQELRDKTAIIAVSLRDYVAADDYLGMLHHTRTLLMFPGVRGVQLLDAEERPLIRQGVLEGKSLRQSIGTQDMPLGQAAIFYALEGIQGQLLYLLWVGLGCGMLGLPLLALGIWLLSGRETADLRHLVVNSAEIGKATDSGKLPGQERPDEIGQLARALAERGGIIRETTARMRLLQQAIEQSDDSVVITDTTGAIQYVNPAFSRIFGYTAAEVAGQNPRILKSGLHPPALYQEMWRTLLAGHVWRGTMTNRGKTGALVKEHVSISPMRDTEGVTTHYVAVKRDLSREEALELQVRQAQKMEAVGTLAGGVAHDFNNVLTAIIGNLDLAAMMGGPAAPDAIQLRDAREAALRAARLVKQLLLFSRRRVETIEDVVIGPILSDLTSMLRRLIGEHITLVVDCASGLWPARADRSGVEQVLTNLVLNARDAMENGGEIHVMAANRLFNDSGQTRPAHAQPGRYLELIVQDNGCGMGPETLEKIFEPFFTTKDVGRGTGLGLAVVYGIVKQLGGWIEVESQLGHGSRFRVLLPAAAATDTAGTTADTATGRGATEEMPTGLAGRRVLLAEDEPMVRELALALMQRHGLKVVTAENGRRALDILREEQGAFDLLFSDVVMPEMNGVELARQASHLWPDLPILLTSGYAEYCDEKNGSGTQPPWPFLPKPYDLRELARRISLMLS